MSSTTFGDAHGGIRTIQLDDVPPDIALEILGHALFEIIPLKPELTLVAAGAFTMVDAVEIEVPRARATKEGTLDGMRSPTFQPKRAAVFAPAIAPWRSFTKAAHWSSGTFSSGRTLR